MNLTKDKFNNIQDNTFQIHFDGTNPLKSTLIEVKKINSATTQEGQLEPFSLVFQAIDDKVYEQNTFQVKHPELGDFELFLVPIGADEEGIRYEAIFT